MVNKVFMVNKVRYSVRKGKWKEKGLERKSVGQCREKPLENPHSGQRGKPRAAVAWGVAVW